MGITDNPDLVSCLRVDLYQCTEHPSKILKPHVPKESTRSAWIPQTMGDQIWVAYLFQTKEQRARWEASLPEQIRAWLEPELFEHIIRFGWETYSP